MSLYMHTASAGGLVVHEGKVLVITSKYWNSIDLPKGTIEPNESLEETAIREVEEETGYRVHIKEDLGSITYDYDSHDGKRYRKNVSFFLMELADLNEPVKNLQGNEDFENVWLLPSEALTQLTHDDTRAVLAKVIDRL